MFDDHDNGFYDGENYIFPKKKTQSYIDGWWEGKEYRDEVDCHQFLVFDMENKDEE